MAQNSGDLFHDESILAVLGRRLIKYIKTRSRLKQSQKRNMVSVAIPSASIVSVKFN